MKTILVILSFIIVSSISVSYCQAEKVNNQKAWIKFDKAVKKEIKERDECQGVDMSLREKSTGDIVCGSSFTCDMMKWPRENDTLEECEKREEAFYTELEEEAKQFTKKLKIREAEFAKKHGPRNKKGV